MAVQRRGYIFGAFSSSVLCVLFIIVAIATDSWVVSTLSSPTQTRESHFKYGLFRGELVINELATPDVNTLYMTCISKACALSCKTTEAARLKEVEVLAVGLRPSLACTAVTDIELDPPLSVPPVISYGLYVGVLVVLFFQLAFALCSAVLAIINATMNPTEPVFGLPGCLGVNIVTAILGFISLLMFGIYWTSSGLKTHLALAHVAFGFFEPGPGLGFSYWLLIPALLCPIVNVVLLRSRAYLLEKDPPPPTIKLENHSDGTIFLY